LHVMPLNPLAPTSARQLAIATSKKFQKLVISTATLSLPATATQPGKHIRIGRSIHSSKWIVVWNEG
jgi:hypothetical protein